MQVRALQKVVGENGILGETPVQAGEKGIHVKDALPRIGSLSKEIVIDVACGGAVGIYASLAGKDAGKVGAVGTLQIHRHPGLQQPIAGNHNAPPPVYHGPVEGMEHGPGQLFRRAYAEGGIRIQGDDIPYAAQPSGVPGLRPQTCPLSPQKAHQLHQRPTFPFPPHIALIRRMKDRHPKKEIKAAAIRFVELLHSRRCSLHPRLFPFPHGTVSIGKITQQTQTQLPTGVSIGQVVAFQQRREFSSAFLPCQQRGNHTQGPALPGDPLFQRHAKDRAWAHHAYRQKIGAVFHDIGDGQGQQYSRPWAVEKKSGQQGKKSGHQNNASDIQITGSNLAARRKKPGPYMAFPPAALCRPEEYVLGQFRLSNALLSGQPADLGTVTRPSLVIHRRVDARRVPAQSLLHPAGVLQKPGELCGSKHTQGGKDRLHSGSQRSLIGILQVLQLPAERGQPLCQCTFERWDQQAQLLLCQRLPLLSPFQKNSQPFRSRFLARGPHKGPRQLHDQRDPPAAQHVPDTPHPSKGLRAISSFPLCQVPVVQQPFRGPLLGPSAR